MIGGNGLTESQPSLSIKALNSQRIILNRARAGGIRRSSQYEPSHDATSARFILSIRYLNMYTIKIISQLFLISPNLTLLLRAPLN
jgi:hypothetical protein